MNDSYANYKDPEDLQKNFLDKLPKNLTHNVIKGKLYIRYAKYLNAA